MVNSIIVTVRFPNLHKDLDLELPCQIPVSQVQKELLDGLKLNGFDDFMGCQKIGLCIGTKPLNEGKSFAEAGIWDGAILSAVLV